ncbi:hypothetical protein KBC89_01835 [Candidatus Woesebacteria bacterium]|nr:hypothetical protein [Candidatus Woesebacteria bacterium]
MHDTDPRGVYTKADFSRALADAMNAAGEKSPAELKRNLLDVLLHLEPNVELPEKFKLILLEQFNIQESDYRLEAVEAVPAAVAEVEAPKDAVLEPLKNPQLENLEKRVAQSSSRVQAWVQNCDTLPSSLDGLQKLVLEAKQIELELVNLVVEAVPEKTVHEEAHRLQNSWTVISVAILRRISEEISKLTPEAGPVQSKVDRIETIITDVRAIIGELTKRLVNPSFDPTTSLPEYSNKSALELVAEIKESFSKAIKVLSRSFEDEKRLEAEDLQTEIGGQLNRLEFDLATRLFEQWKANLETAYPSLRALRVTTEQARQAISAGVPNFLHISQIETLLESNKKLLGNTFPSAQYEEYLSQTFWKPAQQCLDELRQKKSETDASAEVSRWRLDVAQLSTFIDGIIDVGGSSLVNTRSYTDSIALLAGLETRSNPVSHLLENSSSNPLIEVERKKLSERKQRATTVLKERIELAGKEEWENRAEIVALAAIVKDVKAIDITRNIAPHCRVVGPGCHDTKALEDGDATNPGFRARLTGAFDAANLRDLLDPTKVYSQSKEATAAITRLQTSYDEARRHLEACIKRSKEPSEIVDIAEVRAQINKLWDQIAKSEGSEQNKDVVYKAINDPYIKGKSIREAGIIPLAEEFLPLAEQERWKTMIQIHNAFWTALAKSGANQDPIKQMYYRAALESRAGAAGSIDFSKLTEFAHLPEVVPLVAQVKCYFEGNDGPPVPPPGRQHRAGDGVYHYVDNRGVAREYNFGQNGNPSAGEVKQGYLTMQELLDRDFSTTDPALRKSTIYWVTLTEARMHYYTKYYANYTKTADGTFDTGVIALHSPMAALLYKIRGYGVIRPDLQLLWQVLRLPEKGGISQVEAKGIKVDRDKKLKRKRIKLGTRRVGGSIVKGEIVRTNDVLKEYLPQADESKVDPNGAVANKQVLEAIEVRGLRDEKWTLYDDRFEGVAVPQDLFTIPTIWQIVNDESGEFQPISFAEYNTAVLAWQEFIRVIQHPEPITSMAQVDDRISTLVGKIAPFKAFLFLMPRDTVRGEKFRLMLQQLLLRATKQLFDDFNQAVSYPIVQRLGRSLTKKEYFLEFAIEEYTKLNTSDPDLSLFMIAELQKERLPDPKEIVGGTSPSGAKLTLQENLKQVGSQVAATVFTSLFDDTSQDVTSLFVAGFDGRRRDKLLRSYDKPEPPDQKGK